MPIDRFSSDDQMTTTIADVDYAQRDHRVSFHTVSLPNSNDDNAPPVADVMPVRGPVLLAVLMRLARRLRGQTAVSTRGMGPFGGLFWPLLAVGLSACAGKNNPGIQDGGRSPVCQNSTLPYCRISVDAGQVAGVARPFGWGDGAGVMPAPTFLRWGR